MRNSPAATPAEHPTFAAAMEFLRVVREVERRCGGEDLVCDSESAELMCELAGSEDKTLKILEGMWPQLVAESEETVEVGFGIIFDWIKERTKRVGAMANGNDNGQA